MKKFGVKVKGIVKHDDKFLLIKKWYDDRIDEPYQWEFLDGELEYGIEPENYVENMIQEETGLASVVDKIAYTWVYELGDSQVLGLAYLCTTASEMVIVSEQGNEYVWAGAEELADYINNNDILADLKKADII